jgi:hypothetical protein
VAQNGTHAPQGEFSLPHFLLRGETYRQQVADKAYELYLQRGGGHGQDVEDWLRAERLVQEAFSLGLWPEDLLGRN